jgi:hypothetical protein
MKPKICNILLDGKKVGEAECWIENNTVCMKIISLENADKSHIYTIEPIELSLD